MSLAGAASHVHVMDRVIHFWVRDELDPLFPSWDPDNEPERYPSGIGHGLLELYRRLEIAGVPVTIGPVVPSDATTVVLHMEYLWRWDPPDPDDRRILGLMRNLRRVPRIIAIRGDIPFVARLPMPQVIEVMPNPSTVRRHNQIWLPLLPQRGLRPRRIERLGKVQTVGIFAFTVNIPMLYRSQTWKAQLADMGLQLIERSYQPGSGLPSWHDYSDVDVLLGVREDVLGMGMRRKPPTKLINAWAAGVIPIIGANERGSVELARIGDDCLVASDPESVGETLAELANPELVVRLEANGRQRAAEFTQERVMQRWIRLLCMPDTKRRPIATSIATASYLAGAAHRAIGRRVS